jgi:hypothetical protein
MISRTRAVLIGASAVGLLAATEVAIAIAVRPHPTPQAAVRGYLADSSLVFLEPLVGSWRPTAVPPGVDANVVAHQYRWTVGRKALELREGFPVGAPESAQLVGMVYWNPATERVEWIAVAGPDDGQGRLFVGEYRGLEDGSIEREYDVFYRTLEDTPGDELGGSRRRYREVYRMMTPDSIASTLHWFHDGAWRPFGRFAEGGFVRIRGTENDEAALNAHVQELERTTADGGVLIASNARYAAEDGGQTHYGQYFEMIPGRMSARGCLWGERDGEVVGVYWHFFTGWDPVKQKAFFYQTGATGYAGLGQGDWTDDGLHQVEQRFVGEGMAPRIRHESRWVGTDSLVMRSFDATLEGEWRARREYTWVRAERDAPCG